MATVCVLAAGSCRNTGDSSDRRASALTVPTTATASQILAAAQAQVGSPLQAGVAQGFSTAATGLSPQFPAAVLATERKPANVLLPQLCTSALHLQDVGSGAAVDISLNGALPIPAQTVGGYAVYPAALAGATVLHRALPSGSEDFVQIPTRLTNPEVDYSLALKAGIAGLRLVGGSIEMLDAGGTPRLHVSPPFIVGADGVATDATLAVSDYAVDTDPSAPWGRAVTAPGASTCTVRVTWPDATVVYPAILDPRWTTTGSMGTARIEHTIALLSTGRALVAGGRSSISNTTGLTSAELYDPTSGTWSATGSLANGRRLHSMTQLGTSSNSTTSGKMLVAGGINGTTSLGTAELYSPSAGSWSPAGTLNVARHAHTATLLADGRLLIAGGMNGTSTIATAALYNPASGTGSWVATTGPIPAALKNHTATLIQTTNTQLNNHVLVVGGNNGTSTLASVYLFDPVQNAFSTLASISSPREQATALTLQNANGKILVAGGKNGSSVLSSAIVFDPSVSNGTWSSAGTMTSARVGHSMILLPSTIVANGQVLVAGGSSSGSNALSTAELFSGTATWTATPSMPGPMNGHAAVLLSGNSILTAGGSNGTNAQTAAFLYDASFGLSCTSNSQCSSGFCANGVCCNNACNGGTCGACNLAGSLGTCTALSSGTICRAAAGACDVPETCNGTAMTCPSDSLAASGTVCRAPAGECDAAETCSGTSSACPADAKKASGTACTDDGNPCTKDQCDGTAVTCQHPVGNAGVVCRPMAGGCDVAETCTGSSATCPADGFATASTVCRALAGECDLAETCGGSSAACPADAKKTSGTACTDDGNVCTKDQCDGTTALCQHPAGNAGTICRAKAGTCDVAEACTGSSATCPADGFATASTVCRAGAGECDLAENCTGSSSSCPVDAKKASGIACTDDGNVCTKDQCDGTNVVCQHPAGNAGTVCRASAGACDVPESCTGSSASCPADGFAPSSTVCRPIARACDVPESCTGSSASCPADGKVADGTTCNDGNACTQTDTCQAGTCVGGNPVTCTAADQCHTGGTCNPSTGICTNANIANGTPCNDGNACTNGDVCETGVCLGGSPVSCVAVDQCHTGGFCDATTGACALQVAQPDGTPCANGVCIGAACQAVSAASAIPTSIDPTVPIDFQQSTAFLYQGLNASQIGVAPGTIVRTRASVIRGRVLDTSGHGILGASILVVGRPEYGVTVTGTGGVFSMAVNGGEQLRLEYQAEGALPLQRTAFVRPLDYAWIPDVTMTQLDPASTVVNLTASSVQTALATPTIDERGTRRSVLMFFPGTQATLETNDGSIVPLTTLTIRSTELTVGPQGVTAMPASLPPSSGYTYAANLSADEALSGNVKRLTFNQPVINYVDNFLDVPVGIAVPAGYYDTAAGSWVAAPNGIVIKILTITEGVAQLDADGDGSADSAGALAALGISPSEQSTLATLYSPGVTLWRVPISHFTSWDYNYPVTPPADATPPTNPDPGPNNDPTPDPCTETGTIIDCNSQILGEHVDLVGIPFGLSYFSNRSPGWRIAQINIPISGPSVPTSLRRIDLSVALAGQEFNQSFPPLPNQSYLFSWNGADGFGRPVFNEPFPTSIEVRYVYGGLSSFAQSLTQVADAFALDPANPEFLATGPEVVYSEEYASHISLVVPNASVQEGLGGWTLDIHHSYDPRTLTLTTGRGTQVFALPINVQAISNPTTSLLGWDYQPAPDGSLYISNVFPFGFGPNIIDVSASGSYTIIAPNVAPTYLALSGNRLIFAHQVLQGSEDLTGVGIVESLNTDGTPNVVAGSSSSNCIIPNSGSDGLNSGDEGPAVDACIGFIENLAVAPDGEIYIEAASGNSTEVRRIDGGGTIHNALNASATTQYSSEGELAIAADYSIYLVMLTLDGQHHVIKRLQSDGTLASVAGVETGVETCSDTDGSNGIRTSTCDGTVPNVGPDGALYLISRLQFESARFPGQEIFRGAIVKRQPDGRLAELFTGFEGLNIENFKIAPDGDIVAQAQVPRSNPSTAAEYWGNEQVFRLRPSFPGIADSGYAVPAADGTEIYTFDTQGRHLTTSDALTSAIKYQFGYDSVGYVTSITDRNGRLTTVQRDGSGNPTAITSPAGQQTTLSVDANGYLAAVSTPRGAVQQFQYSNGLLTNEVDQRGGIHQFTYDLNGRLIQDQNAVGGGWSLANELSGNTNTVTMTSGEGHIRVYGSTKDLGAQSTAGAEMQGNRQRSVTGSNGLTTTSQVDSLGDSTVISSDGTVVQTTMAADPRFGMAAPYVGNQTVTTPSGIVYAKSKMRTAVVAADGVSLVSQTETTTVNGQASVTTYNGSSRTMILTSPTGRQVVASQDGRGRLTSLQSGGLAPSTFSYDPRGRLSAVISTTDSGSEITNFSYDTFDRPVSIVDPLSESTQLGYDSDNHIASEIWPDSSAMTSTYDLGGDLMSLAPPGRTLHQMTYTSAGDEATYTAPQLDNSPPTISSYNYNRDRQVTAIGRPDGSQITYAYETGSGRLSSITYPAGVSSSSGNIVVSSSYSVATGALDGLTTSDGESLFYLHDGRLISSLTWTGVVSGSLMHGFDSTFRITTESIDNSPPVAINYDADGLLIGMGGLTITRDPESGLAMGSTLGAVTNRETHDGFGKVTDSATSYSNSLILDIQYLRDGFGRIREKTESSGGVSQIYDYSYDSKGRLSQVSLNGDTQVAYLYDPNGNRTTTITTSGTEASSYDGQDRQLSAGNSTFIYTANGELLSKSDGSSGQTTTYAYDGAGNLREVALPDGRIVEYIIDGMNRRVAKKINGTIVHEWLYRDHLAPAAELDGNGVVVSQFIGELLVKQGQSYFTVTDQLGSPRRIVNASTGEVVQKMDYDAFGQVMMDSNPGFQPFGFAGGLYDPDTGLVHFGVRDYDPRVGRWTTKDARRFKGGSTNFYEYAATDPVNGVDRSGMKVERCTRPADIPILGQFVDHMWLRTSSQEAGMGPAGGGVPGDLTSVDAPLSPTAVNDHQIASGGSPDPERQNAGRGDLPGSSCQEIEWVDEQCVDSMLTPGTDLGPWTPNNQCQAFVASVLAACQNMSYPMPNSYDPAEEGPSGDPWWSE